MPRPDPKSSKKNGSKQENDKGAGTKGATRPHRPLVIGLLLIFCSLIFILFNTQIREIIPVSAPALINLPNIMYTFLAIGIVLVIYWGFSTNPILKIALIIVRNILFAGMIYFALTELLVKIVTRLKLTFPIDFHYIGLSLSSLYFGISLRNESNFEHLNKRGWKRFSGIFVSVFLVVSVYLLLLSITSLQDSISETLQITVIAFGAVWILGNIARLASRSDYGSLAFRKVGRYIGVKSSGWALIASLAIAYSRSRPQIFQYISENTPLGLGELGAIEFPYLVLIGALILASLVDDLAEHYGTRKITGLRAKASRFASSCIRRIGFALFLQGFLVMLGELWMPASKLGFGIVGRSLGLMMVAWYTYSQAQKFGDFKLALLSLRMLALSIGGYAFYQGINEFRALTPVVETTLLSFWVLLIAIFLVTVSRNILPLTKDTTPSESSQSKKDQGQDWIQPLFAKVSRFGYPTAMVAALATLYLSLRPILATTLKNRLPLRLSNIGFYEWILGFIVFLVIIKKCRTKLGLLLDGPIRSSTRRKHNQKVIVQEQTDLTRNSAIIDTFLSKGTFRSRYRSLFEETLRSNEIPENLIKDALTPLDEYHDIPPPRFLRFRWRIRRIKAKNKKARRKVHEQLVQNLESLIEIGESDD